ncbi:MAG: hypothetical protein N6V49_10070, partial [Serratia symbiotica]|nr:hypothetical protein [Serratia symbiotica]
GPSGANSSTCSDLFNKALFYINGMIFSAFIYHLLGKFRAYPSRRILQQPVWTGTVGNNRRVQGARDEGEHCPGTKWQIK